MAHGKQGEALNSIRALAPYRCYCLTIRRQVQVRKGIDYVDHQAIERLGAFAYIYGSGTRSPAFTYIQKWELPLILTFAQNGDYAKAMSSVAKMEAASTWLA